MLDGPGKLDLCRLAVFLPSVRSAQNSSQILGQPETMNFDLPEDAVAIMNERPECNYQ